jgi:hypothetical protein
MQCCPSFLLSSHHTNSERNGCSWSSSTQFLLLLSAVITPGEGFQIKGTDAVAAAIWAVVAHWEGQPQDAIVAAVHYGGDTDTIACMAGKADSLRKFELIQPCCCTPSFEQAEPGASLGACSKQVTCGAFSGMNLYADRMHQTCIQQACTMYSPCICRPPLHLALAMHPAGPAVLAGQRQWVVPPVTRLLCKQCEPVGTLIIAAEQIMHLCQHPPADSMRVKGS